MDIRTNLAITRRMVRSGKERALTNINRAIERGDPGATPAGTALIKRVITPLAEDIDAFVQAGMSGKPGRRLACHPLIAGVDPYVLAYFTLKTALGMATTHSLLRTASFRLGKLIDEELRAAKFEASNKNLYNAIVGRARERGTTESRIPQLLQKAERAFHMDIPGWTVKQKENVGAKLLEILMASDSTPVELVETRSKHGGVMHCIAPRSDVLDWFARFNEASLGLRPVYSPLPERPFPWVAPIGGGYGPLVGAITKPIIANERPQHRAALNKADLSQVYTAVNALQDTPWAVNARVLSVMKTLWEAGSTVADLPPRHDEPVPPMPEHLAALPTNDPQRAAHRRKMRDVHMKNVIDRSERLAFQRRINLATEYAALPQFYYPQHVDFRGRIYTSVEQLSPQGSDISKGLLHFATAVPLGETGVDWLAVHGANVFGNDKVSYEERRLWAWENAAKVCAAADDPLTNRWWTEADKPFQFLAWCFEFCDALRHPEGPEAYPSRLPVALDGSCNGLQHFSAMLRDEVAGAAVNLLPGEKPKDIYQTVADRVVELLNSVEEGDKWMADTWINLGIDRKITKRAVMVLPYGGTFRSCLDYVGTAADEKLKGQENPFGQEYPKARGFLAKMVWQAMSDVIVSARQVMGWVQSVARITAKNNVCLSWTTPSGFPVVQVYPDVEKRRTTTRFAGSIIRWSIEEETNTLDTRRAALSSSPNFVHSLDAAALVKTVNACLEEGITFFAMVHDSYGTHAANTERMAELLRREFVGMYLNHDPLQELYESACAALPPEVAQEIPAPPSKGDLNLTAVMESLYFFA